MENYKILLDKRNEYINNSIIKNIKPKIIFFEEQNINLDYSIVIPIHDQEKIIRENILSIFEKTIGNFEIICILDDCNDKTEEILINLFNEFQLKNITRKIIIKQETPIFETSCDNIGFLLSKAPIIIEIQADMKIITYGYNKILSDPIRLYDDIFMVSGRASMNIYNKLCEIKGKGKLSRTIENPLRLEWDDYNKIFLNAIIIRGPIAISNEKIKKLNYFDEKNFYLGNDDFEICLRAYDLYQWRVGYVPIEFHAPLNNGSCRKKKSKKTLDELELRKNNSNLECFNKLKEKYKNINFEEIRNIKYYV